MQIRIFHRSLVTLFICTGLLISTSCSRMNFKETGVRDVAHPKEPLYLTFQLHPPQITHDSLLQMVNEVKKAVGTTGDGVRRQLGFGILMREIVLLPPEMKPEEVARQWITDAFEVGRETDMAVLIHLDNQLFWEGRPDLWQDPDNVEWIDWEGTTLPGRYIDWGFLVLPPPHMCFKSPKVRAEISRQLKEVVAPTILAGVKKLEAEGKGHLFVGVGISSELNIDDYTGLDGRNPRLAKRMIEDNAPRAVLGYNALRYMGYGPDNPPEDFHRTLEEVVQEYGEFLAKQLVEAGIPKEKLYGHVALGNGMTWPPRMKKYPAHGPPWVAINRYSRPGWSMYSFAVDWEDLYELLEEHGNPVWGQMEGNPLTAMKAELEAGEDREAPSVAAQGNARGMLTLYADRLMTTSDYLHACYDHNARLVHLLGWDQENVPGIVDLCAKTLKMPETLATIHKFLKSEPY